MQFDVINVQNALKLNQKNKAICCIFLNQNQNLTISLKLTLRPVKLLGIE